MKKLLFLIVGFSIFAFAYAYDEFEFGALTIKAYVVEGVEDVSTEAFSNDPVSFLNGVGRYDQYKVIEELITSSMLYELVGLGKSKLLSFPVDPGFDVPVELSELLKTTIQISNVESVDAQNGGNLKFTYNVEIIKLKGNVNSDLEFDKYSKNYKVLTEKWKFGNAVELGFKGLDPFGGVSCVGDRCLVYVFEAALPNID